MFFVSRSLHNALLFNYFSVLIPAIEVTDTLGLVLSYEVHGAGIQDRNGAKYVITKVKEKYPSITKFLQIEVMLELSLIHI